MDETNTETSDITTEDKHDTENEKVSHETFGTMPMRTMCES